MKRTSINRIMALVFALTVPGLSLADFSRGASEGVRADLTGTLSVIHIDHLDERQGKNIYILEDKLSKRRYKIKFEVEPAANYTNGSTVRVKGRVQGDELVLEANGSGSIETLEVAYATTSGQQNTLVMVADFKNVGVSCPINDIQDLMFTDPNNTSLDDFYQTNSLGQVSFSGDVAGPYQINYSSTDTCDYYAWANAVEAKAKANGYDTSAYSRKVYVMPKNSCQAAGVGTVGGNPSKAWIFYCNDPAVYAHEIGHNLRLQHASSVSADLSSTSEYGDRGDVMGLTNGYTHFNAPHKEQMGWLSGAQIESVSQSGTYNVAPLEESPTLTTVPQALKIANPDTGDFYYVSYRQKLDAFSSLLPSFQDGFSVHRYKGDGSTSKTYLHGTFGDGEAFTGNGITITQQSHTPEYTTVYIELNSSCTALAPSISISPSSQTGSAGTRLDYTVSVTNRDGRNCFQSNFDLNPSIPSGWNATVSPNSLALMPGDTGTVTLSITSPTTATDSNYSFNVEAFDSSNNVHIAETTGIYEVYTDTKAPTAPTLTASANRKGVSLSWSGATDDVEVVSYRIWRDQQELTTTTSSSYSDKNITSGSSYSYSITSVDGSDNESGKSNQVTVSTGKGAGGSGRGKK